MTTKDNTQDVQGVVEESREVLAVVLNKLDTVMQSGAADLLERRFETLASLLLSEHEGRVGAAQQIDQLTGFANGYRGRAETAEARVEELERALEVLAKDHEATVNVWLPGDHSGSQWMGGKWVHFREFAAQALNPTGAAG